MPFFPQRNEVNEMIGEYLKDHLTIGARYSDRDNSVQVYLLLDDEVISKSEAFLPDLPGRDPMDD
jgi:hypothetical protein